MVRLPRRNCHDYRFLLLYSHLGILSDTSTSRFGRRRPCIVIGCLICYFSLFLLGFPTRIASIFASSEEIVCRAMVKWHLLLLPTPILQRKTIAIFIVVFS